MLRALYEWCADQEYTPYIAAWVNEKTRVPMEYVQDGKIVLNIGAAAVRDLQIDNDWIYFKARFNGVVQEIWVPVGNVLSIFAKETGEGMGFELETVPTQTQPTDTAAATGGNKKILKLVK